MSPLARLPFAIALGAAGMVLLHSEVLPLAKAGGVVAVGLALVAVGMPHRKTVMRLGNLTWTREELCRHVLITGDTGCGKTSSGFNNILVRLTESLPGWGGLVVGVKGDEVEFLTELLGAHDREDQLVSLQVRPADAPATWNPPHRYNLISDRSLPWTAHAKAIVDTASSLTEGRQDAFFKPMAQIALANALQLLEELGRPVTLVRAYHLLTTNRILSEALAELEQREPTQQLVGLSDFFHSTFIESKAPEQREGIEGTIKTYLGFFLDPDLADVFCSDEPNTFEISDVDSGAVMATSMPQRFVTERRYINTYLKILFFYHALRRYELPKAEQAQCNQLLFVADEYQDIVTASNDGVSDHTIIDRIRGARCAIVAGMQSEVSADPAIGRDKRKVLSLNFRTRLIFRAADMEGATASADFIGKKKVWKQTRSSKAWSTVTRSRREDEDYKIKPAKLMELRDHHAVVVHPSKRFLRMLLRPVDGSGKIPKLVRTVSEASQSTSETLDMGGLVYKAGARALACSATDGAPARFPGYVLERRIGRGGMGATVYLARQISTGARVAIKVLPEEFAGDAAVARRFEREIRVMRSVRHPNVVRVVDSGAWPDGARFIVMAYVAGGSLAQHLKKGKRFETASAVKLIAEACRALAMMHDCGIIHRDIKPSNILLDLAGNPKLGDFGLARLANASASSRLTDSGDVIGTFGYMAPEQLQAKNDVDGRADIYALGAVLYQLLAGSIPGGNAPTPSGTRPDAAPYDAVVMRALETNPARRFTTAAEFRQALCAAPHLNRRQAIRRIVVGGIALAGIATGAWGVWRSRRAASHERNRQMGPLFEPQ